MFASRTWRASLAFGSRPAAESRVTWAHGKVQGSRRTGWEGSAEGQEGLEEQGGKGSAGGQGAFYSEGGVEEKYATESPVQQAPVIWPVEGGNVILELVVYSVEGWRDLEGYF